MDQLGQLKSAIIAAGIARNIIEAGAPVTDETLLNIVACLGMGPKQAQPSQDPQYPIGCVKDDPQDYGYYVEWSVQPPPAGTLLYTHPQPSAPVAQAERHVLTDAQVLRHMSRYWEHQWHDGDQHQIRISREQLTAGVNALLSTAPQVEQVEAKEGERN